MDFSNTAEQDELRVAVRDFAARRISSEVVRGGLNPELWSTACTQLGLASLAVDATWVEIGVVLEELGAALAPLPLLSHLVATSLIPSGFEVVSALCSGDLRAAVSLGGGVSAAGGALVGRAEHVIDGDADVLVVVAADVEGEALYLVEQGVVRETLATLDQTRGQVHLLLEGVAAHRIGGQDAVTYARDLMRVAIALESVGAARRALDMTVDYLLTRVQFGRVLGSFQALRHRAADCAVALEAATATARYASWVVNGNPAELGEVAPLAKALATQAFMDIAAEAIQLHGGIGFTWEHDVHLYFKRATANLLLGGDPVAQRRILAASIFCP